MKAKKGYEKGRATVALGEVSGHHHTFTNDVWHKKNAQGLACELILEKEEVLTHQEHESITMPKGEVTVILQREYDVLEGVRQVLD